MLLDLLDLRVVINDQIIYPLYPRRPVVARIHAATLTLVATDGYHITPKLQVPFQPGKVQYLRISCVIDDPVLLAGLLVTSLLYIIAFFSGWLLPSVLCFVPLLLGLYRFYIQKQLFLQVRLTAAA